MEQFTHQSLTAESGLVGHEDLGFVTLRAVIAARQAASPTARALADAGQADDSRRQGRTTQSLIHLLSHGGRTPRLQAVNSGEAVIGDDERHG